MSDAIVYAGVRTARGKGSPKGALHGVTPVRLVSGLLDALRARLGSATVDDVVLGCATQTAEQGANLARAATLLAGWDPAVPGLTINRFCASGLESVALASSRVRAGDARVVVAGGVESVSRVATFSDAGPLYADPEVAAAAGSIHMGVAADLVATLDGIERDVCDRYAHETRAKAHRAPRSPSIVVLPGTTLDHDENIGYQPTLDELAALPSLFGDPRQDAIACARYPQLSALRHIHTKGSSPSLADAAALVVIGDRSAGSATGLPPRARIVATASCAADPVTMLTAGQLAIEQVLARASLRANDIAVFEFAEAFAALCVRLMRALDIGHDRLNPSGGTIARGHAYGATGAALLVDALDELDRRAARHAVVAVSGAAGLGTAILLERLT